MRAGSYDSTVVERLAWCSTEAAQEEREAQALQFQAQSGAQRDFQPAAQRDFQPRERRERSDSYEPFQGRERRTPREFGNVQIKPGTAKCLMLRNRRFLSRSSELWRSALQWLSSAMLHSWEAP